MPSHNFDLTDPKSALRLLLALTVEREGELRIKAPIYDGLDRGRVLMIDFDRNSNEIVLRATSDWGRAVVVQPEATQWSLPANLAPTERTRLAAEAAAERRNMPSDEDLADLEEKLNRTAKVAREVADGKSPMRIRVQQ